MKTPPCLLLLTTLLLVGCSRNAETAKTNEFMVNWLKEHGETNIVVDSAGVGIAGNQTRIRASLYGSTKSENSFAAEVEFDITLPGGGKIVEFVAGSGQTQEKAMDEATLNFVLTTAHVIYKAFMNPADPHQRAKSIAINGVQREMFAGNMIQFGEKEAGPIDLDAMSTQTQDLVATAPLGSGPHWVKVIYSQHRSKPMTVAVTMDNNDAPEMTSAVQNLKWPPREQFYMVKQFIVVK
jgi:Family of unknown function (DUF6348)